MQSYGIEHPMVIKEDEISATIDQLQAAMINSLIDIPAFAGMSNQNCIARVN
ncbi:MAG: hypothetical protein JAY64_08445 [Candidatus Thiodiazotropha weberae]|nr:hypothetical protein [Candidatus Thiodiazotropha lotti]